MYSRDTSEFFKRNITHLGVRDFYTIVTIDGELDSRMEDMFSHIEGQAALIFKGLLSSLNPCESSRSSRPLTLPCSSASRWFAALAIGVS